MLTYATAGGPKGPRLSFVPTQPRLGFSLVELVIVVVIIGIIAAIAAPRISAAGKGANAASLKATLTNVRKAIDHYFAEHGGYPGTSAATGNPDGTAFVDQLTSYSNLAGKTSRAPDAGYAYGPYLRKPFPTNPVNGLADVAVYERRSEASLNGATGWIAVIQDGSFVLNANYEDLARIGVSEEEAQDLTGNDLPLTG